MGIKVAIDGPSGAGKSTIAKKLAKKLGYTYIDTGALYRAIGLYMEREGILDNDQEIEKRVKECVVKLNFDGFVQHVYLCGEDVTDLIRDPKISMAASKVSSLAKVREYLLNYQRELANKTNVIMDGRDIGTVILPDADVKIFLTASIKERTKRRFYQLKSRGKFTDIKEIENDMKKRDENDTNRSEAPLRASKDAIIIDNTKMPRNQTVEYLSRVIRKKSGEEGVIK